MNRIVGFGVAVALCMAAAGIGAYLALRPQQAAVPAAVPAAAAEQVTVPAAQATTGAAGQSAPAEVPAPGAAPVTMASLPTSFAPLATPPADPAATTAAGSSERAPAAKASRPAPSAKPARGAVAGETATAAPASMGGSPAEKAAAGSSVGAGTLPEAAATQPQIAEPVAPPPPQKVLQELVVSADSVIGLRIESTVSSEVARVEDPVEARVTRDVRVGSDVAIPSGSRALGSVIQVERGGKMKNAARVGVRFHTLVLPDGIRMPMQTEAIYREGKSPGQESTAKVGAATVGGAILGAIIGGGKGAAIGGSVGAIGGTGVVMAGGRNPAVLSSGTSLTVRLSQPVTIIVEREELRD